MTIVAIASVVVVVAAVGLFVAARLVQPPANVGNPAERLAPCPARPNCVSSLSEHPRNAMPPLRYRGDLPHARATLIDIVRTMDGAAIITETDDYLHAEFRSTFFRFVDDVEFRFDDGAKVIHFRSASRLGYSDHGVNRRRMARISELFSSGRLP